MLKKGIYEQIINQLFRAKLAEYNSASYYVGEKIIDREEAIIHLSRYLYNIIQGVISSVVDEDGGVEKSIKFINSIIKELGREFNIDDYQNNLIDAKASILTYIIEKASFDYPDLQEYLSQITPLTSLTQSSLFTGKNNQIELCSELKKEILSSDKVDIVVSFIRMSGINLIFRELEQFTKKGNTLRIITTTYMGATQYEAITRLAKLPNTKIKISYNGNSDRLHAKAYLFFRNTGFHTAYIGSSNISKAALTEGLEWNMKATQVELPHILTTVKNTFNTYWEDPTFENFVLGVDDEKLKKALNQQEDNPAFLDYSVLDLIRAKDYQNEVLEKLEVERNLHNHFRNLVVAATGTGKTVIAAFDYKRFKETHPRANFLFVVHREEIIKQACATFRHVLQDENFGDMWYGGHEAKQYNHLFASKDLLNNRIDALNLPEDYFDYIIFDEAHHIVASSYQKILQRFKPKILLGLTATPERMDGQDITIYFDGHISAEIRLDTALNNQLLAPFHYYGITDCVDLADVRWERGRFVASELSKIYTHNDIRTGVIFRSLEKYLPNYCDVRALCFCVDKEHAEYMCAKFTLAGLKCAVMTSDYSEFRNREIKRLANKEINYLFVVDMFNEGVDIPAIDTVLFLRPTESLTIFLQQFGRGLRKTEGKSHLTVLDFVGHSRAEFNYSERFQALMGRTTMSVKEEVEKDFPHLPLKCHIHLEEKAKEYILENINNYINSFRLDKIIRNIQTFRNNFVEPLSLRSFIRLTHVPLEKIYKGRTWNELCVQAGLRNKMSRFNSELARAVNRKWLSTDSHSYFTFIEGLAKKEFNVKVSTMTEIEQRMSLMLYYDLYDTAGVFPSLQAMFNALSEDSVFIQELIEVIDILKDRCEALEQPDNSSLAMTFPLKLHGVYTKTQIQVAIQTSTLERKSPAREGCERQIINGQPVEAMFVDIVKDREVGSNTNYNDFAQSKGLFHWETQNRVRQDSKEGQRYINQEQTMLLFVRKQARSSEDKSRTLGYVYLGEVELVSYSGNKPMQIVWKMKNDIPASVCEYACKYAAG